MSLTVRDVLNFGLHFFVTRLLPDALGFAGGVSLICSSGLSSDRRSLFRCNRIVNRGKDNPFQDRLNKAVKAIFVGEARQNNAGHFVALAFDT